MLFICDAFKMCRHKAKNYYTVVGLVSRRKKRQCFSSAAEDVVDEFDNGYANKA